MQVKMANFFRILVQKRFLSTTRTISSSQSSLTVQFLINSCGLSPESALSTSRKLKIDETKLKNPELVLNFMKSNGLNDTQIAKLIEKRPEILRSRVETNLKPKWEYLIENGYTGKHLAHLVLLNSDRSLNGHIKPSLEFLKDLLGSNDNVIRAVTRCTWLTHDLKKILKPNADFLMKQGVPASNIAKLVSWSPRALAHKPEHFSRKFNVVKKLGLDLESPSFIHALRVMIQMSETTFSKKIQVYKSLGWTQEGIIRMFRQQPFCLSFSEEKIRRSMDYLMNTIKMDRDFVIARPDLMTRSIDMMRRRYNILKALETNKLFKLENRSVASIFSLSEKKFCKYFVAKYEKTIPGLLEMNQGASKAEKLDF